MKKVFISMIVAGAVLGVFSKELTLMADVYLGKPQTHVIQEGESLSRLALRYYGHTDYWRELALINMAPNPDLILVGETILIPSRQTVLELHNAKTISAVKDLVIDEEMAMDNGRGNREMVPEEPVVTSEKSPVAQTEPESQSLPAPTTSPEKESSANATWIWWSIATLIIIGAAGIWWHRRRKPEVVFIRPNGQERHPESQPQRKPSVAAKSGQHEARNGFGKTREEKRREMAVVEE